MRKTNNNAGRTKMQQLLAAIGSRQTDASKNMDAPPYDWYQPHCFNGQQMKKTFRVYRENSDSLWPQNSAPCARNVPRSQ